jgi:hypothetical protein
MIAEDQTLFKEILDLIKKHEEKTGKVLYHYHLYINKKTDIIDGFEVRWHWPKKKDKK